MEPNNLEKLTAALKASDAELSHAFSSQNIAPEYLSSARLLLRLKVLYRASPVKEEILFHTLLQQSSPLYAKLFAIGKDLGFSYGVCSKSPIRLREEFNPFVKEVPIPATVENFTWLFTKSLETRYLQELELIKAYNFSVFHELAHHVLSWQLIPQNKSQLQDYLKFSEALVMLLEEWITGELGSELSQTLSQANVLYKAAPAQWRQDPAHFSRTLHGFFEAKSKPSAFSVAWLKHAEELSHPAPSVSGQFIIDASPGGIRSCMESRQFFEWFSKLFV